MIKIRLFFTKNWVPLVSLLTVNLFLKPQRPHIVKIRSDLTSNKKISFSGFLDDNTAKLFWLFPHIGNFSIERYFNLEIFFKLDH